MSETTDLQPVEMVELASLKPHARNYKSHPDDEIEHLMESIRENGIYRNIVIARDNTILAGHGVAIAARRLNYVEVPAHRLNIESDSPRALKVLAADNEIAHLSENDDRALSQILKEISERDEAGLLGTGYDDKMLANLIYVTRPASEIKTFDEAAAWVGMPEYDPSHEGPTLLVRFASTEDFMEFCKRLDIQADTGRKSMWWPAREGRDDTSALKVVG